jgi:hypothetical protein
MSYCMYCSVCLQMQRNGNCRVIYSTYLQYVCLVPEQERNNARRGLACAPRYAERRRRPPHPDGGRVGPLESAERDHPPFTHLLRFCCPSNFLLSSPRGQEPLLELVQFQIPLQIITESPVPKQDAAFSAAAFHLLKLQ